MSKLLLQMLQTHIKPSFEKLSKWINRYDGFFTSKHANWSGYSRQNQAFYVKSGQWERHGTGIFRYKLYPHNAGERPDLIVPTLWSSDRAGIPQGVISHETALACYKLSTWSGHGVHMTVPENFRRSAICKFKVRLHFAALEEDEVDDLGPFKVTTPLRTLFDVLRSRHIETMHIVDAFADAFRTKQLTFRELKKVKLDEKTRKQLMDVLIRLGHPNAREI